MEHGFTKTIKLILNKKFGKKAGNQIYEQSYLIQYLNQKTKSANKGSKSRGSFANLYAIYVLVEDYINQGFNVKGNYKNYEGANFSSLFKRQRELPFGQKLQNHALNNRLNTEFEKFFPTVDYVPIIRDPAKGKYWFNENLLKIKIGNKTYNLAESVIEIIDAYIDAKTSSFNDFINFCNNVRNVSNEEAIDFIKSLLGIQVDARIFEIVSYSILKYYYHDQAIYWGYKVDDINEDKLSLFKTGRTNANDGGIDFVMKPLGRFFQVTETVDVNKYFLDIDKIERYPITFVVKSNESDKKIKSKIEENARKIYPIESIIKKYMDCIEEIINIPDLLKRLDITIEQGYLHNVLDEIIIQSQVEFNLI